MRRRTLSIVSCELIKGSRMIVDSSDALREQLTATPQATTASLLMCANQEIEFIQSGLSRMLLAQLKLSKLVAEPAYASTLTSTLDTLSLQLYLGTSKLERMLKVCGDYAKGRLAADLFSALLIEFVTFLSSLDALLETKVLPQLLHYSGSKARSTGYSSTLDNVAYFDSLDHQRH